ncbi:MAG: Hemin uptake protein hemP [Sneathiella sp.]|jgi:hemin uptake protein HemP|uniref:hemin uptake protein HemP n=1 Tax=Sneathiella sp. TaxID=1964365 RepID=UPI000C6C30F9|nr:hemin uptake protein HemP [Sneathiella sp.]MAL77934.1 Hemin uptake protein hemP [Sneathiella sp.]|tara:strand:- start:378 stop:551 length:174 start_codon:yes stop_codon:yes gene_type:complete
MLDNQPGGKSSKRMIMLEDETLQSSDLFTQGKELTIIHNSEAYKLRLTGNGKLILTK